MKNRIIKLCDLFCGAGGWTIGAKEALQERGLEYEFTAINHDPIAIATHAKNNPEVRHLCTGIENVKPTSLYKFGELDILIASPECIFHSVARGGRPINDQNRATPFCVAEWAEALRPKRIEVENVVEFLKWGPVDAKGKRIKRLQGTTFQAWFNLICSLGYKGAWRREVAANYGDPTSRERLIIKFALGNRRVVFPESSHASPEVIGKDFFLIRKPWVTAREIIEWDVPGKSIFTRKKPLAENTIRRIEIGMKKFCGLPFTLSQASGGAPRYIGEPVPALVASGAGASLVTVQLTQVDEKGVRIGQPFLIKLRGSADRHMRGESVDSPLGAITAGGGHYALVEAFLLDTNHGNDDGLDKHNDRRVHPLEETMPTMTGSLGTALAQPIIVAFDHKNGNGCPVRGINETVSTITTKTRHAVAQAFVLKYYGNSVGTSMDEPLGATTTKDRFGLAQPVFEINGESYKLDILFRMLTKRETARCQGFPDSFEFTGKAKDIQRQIGNAVPRNLAKAQLSATLAEL